MTCSQRPAVSISLAVLLMVLAACSRTDISEERTMKIAFFEDASVPDHIDLVSPSYLAFDTVMQRRVVEARGIAVEVVRIDAGTDAATAIEMSHDVAADPAYVLALVSPFWQEPPEVARILAEAGVPTMSLSPESASPWISDASMPGDAAELWRRFVPDRATEIQLLAETIGSSPGDETQAVCLVSDGSDYGSRLVSGIEPMLGSLPSIVIDGVDADAAADEVTTSGCRVVFWGGFPPGARDLARAMSEIGTSRGRPVDLAGDALKTAIPPTSPAGDGVVVGSVSCPCADVSVQIDLASRRFLNVYQSEHGLTPGVYAAEAWDAGRIVAGALTSGATSRADVRIIFRSLTAYEGVVRTYTFDADGEPIGIRAELFVAAGTRWLPIPARQG